MSQLTDQVSALRTSIESAALPRDIHARVVDQIQEITRVEADITARVHIEQMFRYIDWVISLPWRVRTKDMLDLSRAKEILEHNHYGLQSVKDRILEYLAVYRLIGKNLKKSPLHPFWRKRVK